MARAFQILGFFTFLFVFILGALQSVPLGLPSAIALLSARIAFEAGAATWTLMFVFCIHSFGIPSERPSFVTSFAFFVIMGMELNILFLFAFR